MGYHVKIRIGEGVEVRTPTGSIRLYLKYIGGINRHKTCKVEIFGSQLVQNGSLEELTQDTFLNLASDVSVKVAECYSRNRIRIYFDKPPTYHVHRIGQ